MLKKITTIPLLILLLAACTKATEDAFIFSSNRDGNSDIFFMNPSSNVLQNLTQSEADEWGATWINKEEISFLRQSGDKISRHHYHLISGLETEIPQLDSCFLDDKNALYHSNGQLQLFQCKADIYLLDQRKATFLNLTADLAGVSAYPSWSFDGQKILFTNNQHGSNDIYMLELETQKLSQLTHYDSNDERAELSPDGKFLLFSSDKFEAGNQDILLKNLASGDLENLSKSKGTELIARWNSNGQSIYFGSDKDGNWEIYSYHLKSGVEKRLTKNDGFDGDPRIR